MRIEAQHVPQRFRFLGSIISKEKELEKDVEHRIRVGWLKWRLAYGVLYDRHIPTRLKRKFYKTTIRPAMTYGVACQLVKKQHIHKMSVGEMRMLRWMYGKTMKDRVRIKGSINM